MELFLRRLRRSDWYHYCLGTHIVAHSLSNVTKSERRCLEAAQ